MAVVRFSRPNRARSVWKTRGVPESRGRRSQLGPVGVSLSTLLSQVGTVIVSHCHGVDTELAQGPSNWTACGLIFPKRNKPPGSSSGSLWKGSETGTRRCPGCHQGDRAAADLQGQVVPAPVGGHRGRHRAPGPQVDHRPCRGGTAGPAAACAPAADGEEEGMVHPVGAEAEHQRQLRAQGRWGRRRVRGAWSRLE